MADLIEETELADIDRHFASFIGRFGGQREVIESAAALLSRAVRQGNICLNLRDPGTVEKICGDDLSTSELDSALEKSRAFGGPDTATPIVIKGDRLYLRRYWDYEQRLASALLRKAHHNKAVGNTAGTSAEAITGVLQNHFSIISGGPGTGKTTTVLQILERLLHLKKTEQLHIALAAPTGKAAARLQELLRHIREKSDLEPKLKERLPQNVSTIHRLLGTKPGSIDFQHNAGNPLPIDVLVVDEASMVALPLMAKLFDAIPEKAQVILLGDPDQLASVEPGSVLADMTDAAKNPGSPLSRALFVLSKNYRFGNENAIYRLSSAVRVGKHDDALDILRRSSGKELGTSETPSPTHLSRHLKGVVIEHYRSYLTEKDPSRALTAFQNFRILSPLREGPFGTGQLNGAIEGILHQDDLISDPSRPYPGKPILVTQNDYQAKLFNGDIGVLLPDPNDTGTNGSQLWAWFMGPDNELRRIFPGRLPEHELAYAMTVHKAQGSEFENVLLILPNRDSPVLSRELIYTGLTRASKRVEIWFSEEVLIAAIKRKANRISGLADALKGPTSQQSLLPLEF